MKPDDRRLACQGLSPYCTDYTGKPCQYEVNGRKRTACALFPTSRGPKSLALGRDWQSVRCADCKAIPAGASIPDQPIPQGRLV